MNHNYAVNFYGCYLDPCLLVLVYEFLPNGSIFHSAWGYCFEQDSLTWSYHLRVATGIPCTLSYMHNALSEPVVRRDVQSLNVLLDESHHAKLSNFGFSLPITLGEEA